MITLDHVGLDRDGRTVLADVDLILTERRIGIIGANGSGKSSLVRLFNGLLMPSRGKVCVNGVDTSDDAKAARRRVGFVLSAGEKQLLAIAGVTAMRPACIVFDEPTTLLDLGNKKRVMVAIDGLAEMAIVVTHDLDSLDAFDRVICLHQGHVHADGAPADVIRAYQDLFTC